MLYYIIYNNTQQGPMNKEELVKYGLNYNSDVWAEGLPSWVKASEIAELKVFIDSLNSKQNAEDDYYFMIINNQQAGPFAIDELLNKGLQADTQVWKNGMNNWTPAAEIPELQKLFRPQTPPPFANTPTPQYAPGGKREAEKACRDHRQCSAKKIVNSFQQGDTPNCIFHQIQAYKLIHYNAGRSFCLS